MYPEIEERLDSLESYMKELTYQQFKTEMSIQALSNEMKEFKDEMKEFKDEVRQDRKAMNKQWGELANKMGTLVEDIIAPAVRPVVRKYFNCDIEYFSVNVKKKQKALNLKGEFDVIAVDDRDRVFLVEAKSTPKKEYFYEFLENIQLFRRLFPEYQDRKLVPIFASLRFDDTIINLATENSVYVMAYREWEYMDILNFDTLNRLSS